jgi:hypothetical protein
MQKLALISSLAISLIKKEPPVRSQTANKSWVLHSDRSGKALVSSLPFFFLPISFLAFLRQVLGRLSLLEHMLVKKTSNKALFSNGEQLHFT